MTAVNLPELEPVVQGQAREQVWQEILQIERDLVAARQVVQELTAELTMRQTILMELK